VSLFPTLERLKPFLRIESAIVIALIIIVVAWLSFSQKANDAREEESRLENSVKTAQDDLDFFARNNERDTLEERLRLLQTEQSPISLPSRESALLFRDDILSYVAEQQLALTQYANEESLTPFGDREYPTIRYSLIAQGDEAALVGMLSLLQDLPTASVQVLQLIKPPEELADWELSLELTLFFSNGGTQVLR